MPKLYYPTPGELQGASSLNEQLWFPRYQRELLALANTNEGRDILGLDSWSKRPYPIVRIQKNMVRYSLGQQHYISEFRVGAKWANVIRFRWQTVRAALARMALQDTMSWLLLGGSPRVSASRFTTSTFYPDPDIETTTVDGSVQRANDPNTWADIRDGSGTFNNDSDTRIDIIIQSSGADPKWTRIRRGIWLFDTSTLGSDSVDSGTFEFVLLSGGGNSDAWTDYISIVTSDPASNTALENSDYADLGSTLQANEIAIASMTDNGAAYTSFTLNATGLGNIATGGVTKYGARCENDLDNTEPTWASDSSGQCLTIAADVSGTSTDPKLVISHTSTFVPKTIVF
jgi:hypothetical protein